MKSSVSRRIGQAWRVGLGSPPEHRELSLRKDKATTWLLENETDEFETLPLWIQQLVIELERR